MAGRLTFRNDKSHGLNGRHPLNFAAWVVPQQRDYKVARTLLSNALGRALSDTEFEAIIERCAEATTHDQLVRLLEDAQSIKRTLASISKIKPALAIQAFNDCDSLTQAEIATALIFDLQVDPWDATPGQIIVAAGIAMERCNARKAKRGRRKKGYQRSLAAFCIESWLALSHSDDLRIWRGTGRNTALRRMSPLMRWCYAIFSLTEGKEPDPSQLEKLLREAATLRQKI